MNHKKCFMMIAVVIFSFLLFLNSAFCCTSLVVGKDASVDGSVIFTHNEELSGDTAQTIEVLPRKNYKPGSFVVLESGTEVPQVETTYKYIQFNSNYVDLADARRPYNADNPNCINEWQIITGDNGAGCRPELKEESGTITPAEIKYFIAQRAKTAREGVEIAGRLIDTYGFSRNGMMFIIADSNEGWWLEAFKGKHWVAQKCPDNAVMVRANSARIGKIDLNDTDNFLGSKDLESYAIEKGWYIPTTDGEFDVEKAYSDPVRGVRSYDTLREMAAVNYFSPSKKIANMDEEKPESMIIVPDRKVSKEDCMAFQRLHYEGTENDLTEGYSLGSPHYTENRTVCIARTQTCAVVQLRNWLPNEIGGCLWLTQASPCTSVFVPWYLGITESPDVYQGAIDRVDLGKAWWRFKAIVILVDANYAELVKIIQPVWENQEKTEFALQEDVEKTALELYQKGAGFATYLTNYSNSWALTAYDKAGALIDECLRVLAINQQ